MSTDCERCGFKSNEVKSGGPIQNQGCRLSVQVKEVSEINPILPLIFNIKPVDLARDLLKSDTCTIEIPEIDIEFGPGMFSGRFTTVEGMLTAMKEKLESQAPFFLGDSTLEGERRTFKARLDRLDAAIRLEEPCTLILDDPAGNSYIQVID